MRLVFSVGDHVLEVFVDKKRDISLRGPMTNDKIVSFDELTRLSKQDDTREASLSKSIVRDLRDPQDVVDYLRFEFVKQPGVEFIKTEL